MGVSSRIDKQDAKRDAWIMSVREAETISELAKILQSVSKHLSNQERASIIDGLEDVTYNAIEFAVSNWREGKFYVRNDRVLWRSGPLGLGNHNPLRGDSKLRRSRRNSGRPISGCIPKR